LFRISELKQHKNKYLREGMTEENNDLASRGARLGAVIFDVLIIFPILFGIAKATGFWDTIFPRLANGIPLSIEENIVAFLVGQTLFLVLNGAFLIKNGQTIGKKIMNVKIVSMQRKQVGIVKLYTLRYLVFSFAYQIPAVGPLINLINVLFIFGKERRCIHDRIAGTFVIKAK
jgi:uncharacterized RDD family membrane protein YckC